jgi:hypothetical protein
MWYYSQSQGTVHYNGEFVGKGYSGYGGSCNRPDFEHLPGEGPIPRGLYAIGSAFKHHSKGSYVMRLTPSGHDARGRTAFLIHGDSIKRPETASEGCIVLSLEYRKRISASGDASLLVTW